ncbi:MAG: uncharacterized protein QG670_1694 [Thermoproteota archaeon]|nr:uncharacterized protein [Thermoproteota archaeon]
MMSQREIIVGVVVQGLKVLVFLLMVFIILANNLYFRPENAEAVLSSFDDPSNPNMLSSSWNWINPPQNYSLTSEGLTVTPTLDSNFWAGVETGQFLYQLINGSFTVETKVSSTLSVNFQQTGLMVRQDANNFAKICFEYSDGLCVKTGIIGWVVREDGDKQEWCGECGAAHAHPSRHFYCVVDGS